MKYQNIDNKKYHNKDYKTLAKRSTKELYYFNFKVSLIPKHLFQMSGGIKLIQL
jgi:hypothetical protein